MLVNVGDKHVLYLSHCIQILNFESEHYIQSLGERTNKQKSSVNNIDLCQHKQIYI